ncbi:hypothetical protein HPO96_30950 [Kribbella sandramycini]|uniref:DUF3592 domain-containing protein n=1 Tax=Kribbella sandramycini TaxID=60450 RepID=A0A7Y4P2D6_9ACTN|nr:DUF3592 domain-containing protein [Kribbella sandramycini]MBB6566954.1 hypothetical protein [Kribbella sandramycini]NOL44676.1 hypothetical protein [Kribbella sandramycini]
MTYPAQPAYPRAPKPRFGLAAVLMLVLPLLIAVPAAIHGAGKLALLLRAETATGIVVSGSPGEKTKSVDVTFTTRAGETVTTDLTAANPYAKGDSIDLYYDRKKPSRLKDADIPLWSDAVFALGVLFPALFIIDAVRRIRRREP